jgi:hypothetical protein
MEQPRYNRTEKFWHAVQYSIGGSAQLWSKGSEQEALFALADDLETIQRLAPPGRQLSAREVAARITNQFLLGAI